MSKTWMHTSREQLEAAGYVFDRDSRCSGKYRGGTCNVPIHWYRTPDGKMMPITAQTFEPHWSSCPDRKLFRKPKEKKADETTGNAGPE